MTGSWQCWRDIYESAGGRVGAFNDCVALSTLAHFSLFFHLCHIARSCCRCVVSLNLFTLTTAICGPVACSSGREGGWWWRQTPADNSWLCLMSNWHYNGCPHSRWNSPPVSAVSALNLLAASPEGTIGMFLHRLPHSLWSVLNRKLCSHFAQLFLGLLGGGTPLAVWSHSHYCCTHPADLNKHNHHAAPCLATFLRPPPCPFFFLSC